MTYEESALKNLEAVMASGVLGDPRGTGPFNRRFENLFKDRLRRAHALTMNSATAALHTALLGMGVGPGDEVIVDPLLKYGAVAALHAGAIPVFADIESGTFLIDADSVAGLITERTRGIICTEVFGLLPDTPRIMRIAAARGIGVVEDCAQAIMATRDGRTSGTGCDAGVFSFQMTKHLSTGEGGMLVTDRDDIYQRALAVREHGWQPNDSPFQDSLGWMYRMPEVCAAIGVAGFEFLETVLASHERIASMLNDAVGDIPWIRPQAVPSGARHVYWTWGACVEDERMMEMIAARLAALGADFEIGYCAGGPIYLRPLFQRDLASDPELARRYRPGLCPNAERLIARMIHIRIDARRGEEYYAGQAALLASAAGEVERRASVHATL